MIFPGNWGYSSSISPSTQASRSLPHTDELGFAAVHTSYEMESLEGHRFTQLQNGETQFFPRASYSTCSRVEYPGVNRTLAMPLELSRPANLTGQVQTDNVDQGLRMAFSHSAYCGPHFTPGSLNPGMSNSPHSLALSFHSSWPPQQVLQIRQRKKRVPYSKHQITELERAFEENRFLTPEIRQNISVKLGLTERQVKIWFQNQRQKEKKLLLRQPSGTSGPLVASTIGAGQT
ncbi:homeobox protein Hox-D12-like [Latimeria chalumnae]|uniref:Homeobox domain-containing protein n=2 Tax=Latimeria TaxID=7896 RepID=H3BD66_LATCH|nr:PREDICTED: homeobox protein Hox-D12-like [Latimeria chalumnae]ACL81433.1 HoxA14 [Latimeria menadoensis]|eukprot:XP_005993151.1 PREDICTED: homeobox protein Hox-D12-like [Latimeria chalumnae]